MTFTPNSTGAPDICAAEPALRDVRPGQAAACQFAPWETWPPEAAPTGHRTGSAPTGHQSGSSEAADG